MKSNDLTYLFNMSYDPLIYLFILSINHLVYIKYVYINSYFFWSYLPIILTFRILDMSFTLLQDIDKIIYKKLKEWDKYGFKDIDL